MTLGVVKLSNFHQAPTAMFMSGEGIVKSRRYEGEHWTYLVDMALDIKPNFAKIGVETMVLLSEADFHAA